MNCIVDIKREGNVTIAYLPFNPRIEFDVLKGSIYANCIINGISFKTKLMSRGNAFCILFNKKLLASIGLDGNDNVHIPLSIEAATEVKTTELPDMVDNDVLKAINERSSIRRFSEKGISDALSNAILNAGLCAPSASNKRPFHFILTKDKEKMMRLAENNRYVKMLEDAVACIIICGDKVIQGTPEYLLADCCAATQNILLAIHSVGLGGVWCGVAQNAELYKKIIKEFGLPNHIRPVSLIAFGFPAEKKTQSNRFETNKLHFEVW